MRIVFFGSPDFALPALEALLAGRHEVVAVVTQPDRPAGRGHAETPPPVKAVALTYGVRVLQPARVSDEQSVEALRALEADVFVVAAYGQILRRAVLELQAGQAVPAERAVRVGRADLAELVAQAGLARLAVQAGLARPAVQADRGAQAARVDLVIQADPAAQVAPVVRAATKPSGIRWQTPG